jgi:hypothetical protein
MEQQYDTLFPHVQHGFMEAFFPHRTAVTKDYWEYIWWRAGHRLASAMLNNFATQVRSRQIASFQVLS